jgi:hypothetical protein
VANYVKSTNFAVKDGLPSGDPLKVVKGTEIDTEFNNIATAVASKANISSPAFLGTPFAPTASAGTATNQIATTAFVTAALQALYPIGSIYTNATNATNPGTLLGFGTWVAFGAGRVPVGFDSGDSNFNAAEKIGGSKNAIVVAHTHTFSGNTNTTGNHTHGAWSNSTADSSDVKNWGRGDARSVGASNDSSTGYRTTLAGSGVNGLSTEGNHAHTISGTTASAGSSGTNANLQPYITVFMWKRVS